MASSASICIQVKKENTTISCKVIDQSLKVASDYLAEVIGKIFKFNLVISLRFPDFTLKRKAIGNRRSLRTVGTDLNELGCVMHNKLYVLNQC